MFLFLKTMYVRFSCLPTLFGDKWNDEWVGSVNRGKGDEKNQR